MSRVVIVGGYGAFGARAAERLARADELEVIVAGRSLARAREAIDALALGGARAKLRAVALDASTARQADIEALGATVLINASGPFQAQDYSLAQACIGAGCHYIDLADARSFVTGIGALDAAARAANVCVISGASSVPGISSVAVGEIAQNFSAVEEVHVGISPGNSFDPGVATVASIVGAAGKPFTVLVDGRWRKGYGWLGLSRHRFAEIGTRWMSEVDVPDLELMPLRYPQLTTARFTAGLEVGMFHLGLWVAASLAYAGVLRRPEKLARPLLAMKRRLSFLGSDKGGMFVQVVGRDAGGHRLARSWNLTARSGHGPYVPAIASVILAKKLVAGEGPPPGAGPCFGLFALRDFEAEVEDLDITCTITQDFAGEMTPGRAQIPTDDPA